MRAQGVWRPLCAPGEIIEISSVGWRPRAHPTYHARSFTNSVMLFNCQRPALRHTYTASLPSGNELDKMPQLTDKTKKSGRPFLVAARFLKPV